jgi:hypothetical protein
MSGNDLNRLHDFVEQLLASAESNGVTSDAIAALSIKKRKHLRSLLDRARDVLDGLASQLDPISAPPVMLDPYQPDVVGRFIGTEMLRQPLQPLGDFTKFYGSGVYSIYYSGPHRAYQRISKTDHPIYVGKADPDEPNAETPRNQGVKLAGRLMDHAKSIAAVSNLELGDFRFRCLVVRSGLQKAAEDFLINQCRPVWNDVIIGFGKHGDSATTRANTRSEWDTLHPGRRWAHTPGNIPNPLPEAALIGKVTAHFESILGKDSPR